MDDEIISSLKAVIERLGTLIAHDPALRSELRRLVGALLSEPVAAQRAEGGADAGNEPAREQGAAGLADPPELVAEPAVEQPAAAPSASPVAPAPAPAERVVTKLLTLGATPALAREEAPPTPATPRPTTSDADLPLIEKRCRLKAEGALWAVTRELRRHEGADLVTEIAPQDRDLIDRANQLPNCFMWMNSADFSLPENFSYLEDVARCFESVANTIALLCELLADRDANREYLEQALDLLAEAQSALRVAVGCVDNRADADQRSIFEWLKMTTHEQQIYIEHYMRLTDPANPANLPRLHSRLDVLEAKFRESRKRAKQHKELFNGLRYHASRIREGRGTEHDWVKVSQVIDEIVREGIPPSNRAVREQILPILEDLPDLADVPLGFDRVLREVDRYMATRPMLPASPTGPEPSAAVREVARLLAGKAVLLIGGVRRPEAQTALERAFGLKELIWFETREHQSISLFESSVARPDVALVILAVRWSSHSFGDVKQFCDRYGKPLVRLPGGYNPNQIAAQILAQSSGQLAPIS
ncbi:MAG TPA: DUF2325 domain-containing protein [Isosphaeraceae bacterium]|nr:DUF2325 domain-containing protein [Isosphaeraceae bacterium]